MIQRGRQTWQRRFWQTGIPVTLLGMGLGSYWEMMQPSVVRAKTQVASQHPTQRSNEFFAQTYQGVNGTCKWKIDGYGVLHVYSGTLEPTGGSWSKWGMVKDKIRSISIEGHVKLPSSAGYTFGDLGDIGEIKGLENIDASQVRSMQGLFTGDRITGTLDLNSWDTSNLSMVMDLFADSSIDKIKMDRWDMSHVTSTMTMFSGLRTDSLNLSGWNLAEATDLYDMFDGASMTSLNVSGWQTPKLTSVKNAFQGMKNLRLLDLSSFDLTHIETDYHGFSGMLGGTSNLRTLKLGPKSVLCDSPKRQSADLITPDSNSLYTGKWQNVGAGTVKDPQGKQVLTADQLMLQYDGSQPDTYVWQPKMGSVLVHYLDEDGEKIQPDKTVTGRVTTAYQLPELDAHKYQLLQRSDDGLGNFESEPSEVTLIYRKRLGQATAYYIDGSTGRLLDATTTQGLLGDSYVLAEKKYPHLQLVVQPEMQTGSYQETEQTVFFVYQSEKKEDLKPELPKPELPKPELPKPEQPKPELPKPEFPNPELPKPELPKPELPKPELPKPEQPKPGKPVPNPTIPKPTVPTKPVLPTKPEPPVIKPTSPVIRPVLPATRPQVSAPNRTVADLRRLSAQNYTTHVGSALPTLDDFKAVATNRQGQSEAVYLDLGQANLNAVGSYPVTLTTSDGQRLVVQLIVVDYQSVKPISASANDLVTGHDGDAIDEGTTDDQPSTPAEDKQENNQPATHEKASQGSAGDTARPANKVLPATGTTENWLARIVGVSLGSLIVILWRRRK